MNVDPAAEVWVFAPDLMDRSRLLAAHPDAVIAATLDDLLSAPASALVLVDLRRAGVLDVVRRMAGARTVGFASHVDSELIAAARAAGCDEVLARSVFFRRYGAGVTP